MASSTVSGVGSGIDTQSIVTALVAAEKAPKQAQIDKQTTTASTTLSGLSVIKSALDTYRTAIAKLNTASSFNGLAITSSESKTATATIDGTATSGSYALTVTQLATASKVTSAVFADGASSVVNNTDEDATLTISQGDTDYNIDVPQGATLQETRDAINAKLSGQGISANILTGASGSRLVISSTTTGEGSDLTISGAGDLGANATATAGLNAKYTLDGNEVESKSNTVTALSGVTLTLLAKGDSTVAVANNTSALKTSAQSFVTAYNALMTAINTQTKVTATTTTTDGAGTTAGALTGDATMRTLVSTLRNQLLGGTGSDAGSSGLTSLSQLGITTDKSTGLLSINDTQWDKAAPLYGASMAKLFTGTDGLLGRMTSATDSYAVTGGTLATRQAAISSTLTDLSTQQASLDKRIASLQTTLSAKYTAMDTIVAQLNATSSSIMTTLNSLNNTSDD